MTYTLADESRPTPCGFVTPAVARTACKAPSRSYAYDPRVTRVGHIDCAGGIHSQPTGVAEAATHRDRRSAAHWVFGDLIVSANVHVTGGVHGDGVWARQAGGHRYGRSAACWDLYHIAIGGIGDIEVSAAVISRPSGEPNPVMLTVDISALLRVPCSFGTRTTRVLPVSEIYRFPLHPALTRSDLTDRRRRLCLA